MQHPFWCNRDFRQREQGRRNPQKDWGENAVVAEITKQNAARDIFERCSKSLFQFLISHDDGVINDEELLLLQDLNRSYNLDLPYNSQAGFDFDYLEVKF